MSLGLVVLEEKLFTRTRTPTPQSDDIKTNQPTEWVNSMVVVEKANCENCQSDSTQKT